MLCHFLNQLRTVCHSICDLTFTQQTSHTCGIVAVLIDISGVICLYVRPRRMVSCIGSTQRVQTGMWRQGCHRGGIFLTSFGIFQILMTGLRSLLVEITVRKERTMFATLNQVRDIGLELVRSFGTSELICGTCCPSPLVREWGRAPSRCESAQLSTTGRNECKLTYAENVHAAHLLNVFSISTVAVKVHLLGVGYSQRYPWEPVPALDTVRAHGQFVCWTGASFGSIQLSLCANWCNSSASVGAKVCSKLQGLLFRFLSAVFDTVHILKCIAFISALLFVSGYDLSHYLWNLLT